MKTTRIRRLVSISAVLQLIAVAAIPCAAQTHSWTGAGDGSDWFVKENWTPQEVPGTGAEVAIWTGATVSLTNETAELAAFTMTGGTLTFSNWMTRVRADTVLLDGESVLTLPAAGFTEAGTPNRVWIVCQTFTIESNAVIDAADRGYVQNQGPGKGGFSTTQLGGGGGGHGGRGAPTAERHTHGGLRYGNPAWPVSPGSGGSMSTSTPKNGGMGGGAILIDAAGTATVRGIISADGQSATAYGATGDTIGGGGSGGSILLQCATFQGDVNGLLSAAGGDSWGRGAPGGGGRIAVLYDPAAQAALANPNRGVRFRAAQGVNGNPRRHLAETGSLYLPDSLLLSGNMSATQWDGVIFVLPGTELAVDSLTLAGRIGFEGLRKLQVNNNLTLATGAGLTLVAAPTNNPALEYGILLDVGGHLEINSGSHLLLISNPTNGAVPMIQVDSLDLKANGLINARDRGYATVTGPGRGAGTGAGGAGASHGGHGSPGYTGWNHRLGTYGSVQAPVTPGSGGGTSECGGYGGGAIIIQAAGVVTLNGTLNADGQNSYIGVHGHSGGGAGGTISIQGETVQGGGTGWLSARGETGSAWGSGVGGGGRLAVVYNPTAQAALANPNPGLRFSARAGIGGFRPGLIAEPGTLYLPDALWLTSPLTAALWDDVRVVLGETESWQTGSLTISGKIGFPALRTLQVTQDLTILGGGVLTLMAGPTNAVQPDYGTRLDVGGTLTVANQGGMIFVSDLASGAAPYVECHRLDLQAGGLLQANSRGFDRALGPGASTGYAGAGYGGAGGTGVSGTAGQPYGYVHAPLPPGSGSAADNANLGERGGGAIRIGARDTMQLNGTIQASGGLGLYLGRGAGSGGGLLLSARQVSGTGSLLANGGAGYGSNSSPGSGGRIAVWTPMIEPAFARRMAGGHLAQSKAAMQLTQAEWVGLESATITAAAGTPGTAAPAQDGTVFFGHLTTGTLIRMR